MSPRDQDTELTLRVADRRSEWSALWALIDRFADRYTHPMTRRQYRAELSALLSFAGLTHPRLLTEAVVNQWVALARTNNTLRGRLTRACVFLRWCVRHGEADPRLVEHLLNVEQVEEVSAVIVTDNTDRSAFDPVPLSHGPTTSTTQLKAHLGTGSEPAFAGPSRTHLSSPETREAEMRPRWSLLDQ